jgi:prevent-host-death family protein
MRSSVPYCPWKGKEHMANRTSLNLDVDLQRGVVPISKAASSLAALIKRASVTGQPVIVTQKGYPTGVLLPVELFTALKALVRGEGEGEGEGEPLPEPVEAITEAITEGDAADEQEAPAPKARRSPARRRKVAEAAG